MVAVLSVATLVALVVVLDVVLVVALVVVAEVPVASGSDGLVKEVAEVVVEVVVLSTD